MCQIKFRFNNKIFMKMNIYIYIYIYIYIIHLVVDTSEEADTCTKYQNVVIKF